MHEDHAQPPPHAPRSTEDIRQELESHRLTSIHFLATAAPEWIEEHLEQFTPPPTKSFLPEPEELRRHKERGAA